MSGSCVGSMCAICVDVVVLFLSYKRIQRLSPSPALLQRILLSSIYDSIWHRALPILVLLFTALEAALGERKHFNACRKLPIFGNPGCYVHIFSHEVHGFSPVDLKAYCRWIAEDC